VKIHASDHGSGGARDHGTHQSAGVHSFWRRRRRKWGESKIKNDRENVRVLSEGRERRKHQNYLEIRNWTEGKKGTKFCDDNIT